METLKYKRKKDKKKNYVFNFKLGYKFIIIIILLLLVWKYVSWFIQQSLNKKSRPPLDFEKKESV